MSLSSSQSSFSWHGPSNGTLVLGHRGARHAAPENTLAAFELARLEGAAGTELDVQCSADGAVHVVHDLDLTRVTGGRDRRRVQDLTRKELDQVELLGAAGIPRLEDVLAWAEQHGLLLNVELKSANARHDRIPEATAALLQAPYAKAQICVSSFHPQLLRRFHLAAPEIRTAFLVAKEHVAWCTPAWLKRLGCSAVHPQASLLLADATLGQRLQGYQVNTWTVNDPAAAAQLAKRGVFAVISDNPGLILKSALFQRT